MTIGNEATARKQDDRVLVGRTGCQYRVLMGDKLVTEDSSKEFVLYVARALHAYQKGPEGPFVPDARC